MNVMARPILLESSEGCRRYQIIAVHCLYIGFIWCASYIGVIAVFFIEYFKATFFHGFLAKNEWRLERHCQGVVEMAGPICLRSALVVIFKNRIQIQRCL